MSILVKFSVLQEHGIDKVFFLENDNVDASQKNVVFVARGEKASAAIAIAGMSTQASLPSENSVVPFYETRVVGYGESSVEMGS